jgi:putative acetyltransferase
VNLVITAVDPRDADVRALLEAHLSFARAVTPPGHVHALDLEGLLDPAVTLFGARRNEVLLGIGALKRVDDARAEIKSMHTREEARGGGVGRAVVDHLLAVARDGGYRYVLLETGTNEAFVPATALYASVGFTSCDPFGQYTDNPHSVCMRISVGTRRPGGA